MLRVSFAAPGKEVADLGLDEFKALVQSEGKSILDLKWHLSRKVGCPLFRPSIVEVKGGFMTTRGITFGLAMQLVLRFFPHLLKV